MFGRPRIVLLWLALGIDAMDAILVDQNKSLSLRWELNSFFLQILRENFF